MLTPRQLQLLRREPEAPNRLKAAMRLAGKTQIEVGAGTGFTQGMVSRIANTSNGVTVATAARFATYFGCRIEDLFPLQVSVEVRHAS